MAIQEVILQVDDEKTDMDDFMADIHDIFADDLNDGTVKIVTK